MKIIRRRVDAEVMRTLEGKFCHVKTDGTLYLVGGACRSVLLGNTPNDYDFTVIGGTSYTIDHRPRGNKRIEVENTAIVSKTLGAYMVGRDFTINQVAIDSKGFIYGTQEFFRDWDAKVLRPVNAEVSNREVVRAVRFAKELGLTMTVNLRKQVKSKLANHEYDYRLASRYIHQGLLDRRDLS